MSNDPKLGREIHDVLVNAGIETPMANPAMYAAKVISSNHQSTMEVLGLDMSDDSLKETPERVSRMFCEEIFGGLDYSNFPSCTTIENKMSCDEMVAVNKIDVLSMCEHHFIPFIGHASIAYIPGTRILGLSKFNRVTDFFSRRPQVQERLNMQIHAALVHILKTEDVAVTIRADHMCVKLRGIKQNSETITSQMSGRFMSNPALRAEFLALTRG